GVSQHLDSSGVLKEKRATDLFGMRTEEGPGQRPADRLEGWRCGQIVAAAVGGASQRQIEAAPAGEGRTAANVDSGRRRIEKIPVRVVSIILIDPRRDRSLAEVRSQGERDSEREIAG